VGQKDLGSSFHSEPSSDDFFILARMASPVSKTIYVLEMKRVREPKDDFSVSVNG